MAGYQFVVLNNVFTCHWGFKDKTARPGWRASQVFRNFKKVSAFKLEVKARYGWNKENPSKKIIRKG